MCQVSANTNVSCFDVGVFSSPINKNHLFTFSSFPLIGGYWYFDCKRQYDIQVHQVSASTNVSYFDVGMSSSPISKTICSFVVHFLLLVPIDTLNVSDNMLLKCVKLVQILTLVVLMWMCLPHPSIRPFVNFLLHYSYWWLLILWM